MADVKAPLPGDTIPRWRIFRSDTGRLWATREVPFAQAAEDVDAHRTVEADDWPALVLAMAEQESRAALVAP